MLGARPPAATSPDDDQISGMAAMIAIGGHAVVILAALLLAGRTSEITIAPNVVGVTLVSGEPGTPAPGPRRPARPLAPASATLAAPPFDTVSAGESLDSLTDTSTPSPAGALAASGTSAGTDDSPTRTATGSDGSSGSSRADQGLGQGEGAVGVDLYAAASLPDVGPRPMTPPAGDLWRKVSPCWRSAAPRSTTLIVTLEPDGALAGAPRSVRRRGVQVDSQTLLAERAAVRALQACAPYAGLAARQWRVAFP